MPDSSLGPDSLSSSHTSYPTAAQNAWRWIPLALIVAILVCGGVEWFGLQAIHSAISVHGPRWFIAISLVLLHVVQAVIVTEIIKTFPISTKWTWRTGFLTAGFLAVIAAFVINNQAEAPSIFFSLVFGCLGAFTGSLVLTGYRMGLWEDNFPPSQEVTLSVYQRHQQEIPVVKHGSIAKRAFDILLASLGLLLSAPLSLLILLFIWWEDPGPVMFVKNSVGKGGKNFHQFKFRTMIRDAEKTTGPILANGEDDHRVLHIGRFLRKTALDELPQLVNILTGEMSFVGPRPQRTVLVAGYLDQVPGYAKRHQIAPGLAGLAQVAGSYYISPEEKLHWDLIYIERASLRFDLKLILLAFMIVFWYRWQKDWDEHTPNRWLKIQSKDLN